MSRRWVTIIMSILRSMDFYHTAVITCIHIYNKRWYQSFVAFTLICCSLHKTVQQNSKYRLVKSCPCAPGLGEVVVDKLFLVAIVLCLESIQSKGSPSVPCDPGIVYSFMRWPPYWVFRSASQKLFVGPERSDTSHSVLRTV